MVFVHPVPRYKDGREPVTSSSYRSADRPDHVGDDIMYPRVPADGGPPNELAPPHFARRFFMPFGVPALSIGPGTVSISQDIGTGGYVKIEHESGLSSQYMHLKDRRVKVGDQVSAGEPIGTIYFNPSESGFPLVHLHFQLRRYGVLIDPGPFLSQVPVLDDPTWPLWAKIALAAAAGYALYEVVR